MKHNIPLSTPQCEVPGPEKCNFTKAVFTHAITIDPEGSLDHDDALTCQVTQSGDVETCTVGVHITDVQMFLPKESALDQLAAERGCTVYNAPDSIASPMLPNAITEKASIAPNKEVKAFTIVSTFTINKKSQATKVSDVRIMESKVTSHAELTYAEAQALLFDEQLSQTLLTKTRSYNSSKPPLPLDKVIKVLWNLAWFLRKQRLHDAALAFTVREQDHLLYPEAHYLVEEFMIWANRKVAETLTREFPNGTILRTQAAPNEDELKAFKESHKSIMPLSAAFKSYVTSSDQAVDPLIMLKSVHRTLWQNLRDGKVRQAMHCMNFEHYHPQLAALHSLSKFVQSPGQYSCTNEESAQSHWSLMCKVYTHFTSPLRRYIDVVVQRQLCVVLRGKPNMYEAKELKAICTESKVRQKEAQEYERDVASHTLANSLQQCSREYNCFVTKVNFETGRISLYFTDMDLQILRSETISLQHLQINDYARNEPNNYVWKVKSCSINGSAANFFNQSEVEPMKKSDGNEIQISTYSPDDAKHLNERRISLKIATKVTTVTAKTWSELQQCTMVGEERIRASTKALLQKVTPDIAKQQDPNPELKKISPLCIYTLCRPIKAFESMTVQLSASRVRTMLEPTIQLLEVGPGLKVCVQHNKNPTHCFVGKLTTSASNDTYSSLARYIRCWEPLVVAEAACSAVKESEFLIIRGVQLHWLTLQPHVSSSGESYYKMVVSDGAKEGVFLELSSQFMQSSFRFFKMSKGDLTCVRFSSNDSNVNYVFHMVIHRVDIDDTKSQIYLKFVVEETNYISHRAYKAIQDGGSCEIQLIPLGVPHRRIYQSLQSLTSGSKLAERIAVGRATSVPKQHPGVKGILPFDQVSVATSYWPFRKRPDGRGRQKLNKFQRTAIDLACSSSFVMIQGPPGTGKSVTGAHIAYALAMKLRKEVQMGKRRDKDREGKKLCVMYCGPSQQSVNVVLEMFHQIMSCADHPNLNIIRVFSKAVERKDYSGPKLNLDVFPLESTGAECEVEHQCYSLHHIIRSSKPEISHMEKEFQALHRKGKIPSHDDFQQYQEMVSEEEMKALKGDIDIVLCTCNEAASRRIAESLKPVYCIVDECAMATEPECMVPISRAEHVVLIGDHQQLQPVIQYREAEKMGLGQSLFERYAKKVRPHLLEVQYRMHRALCEFPSEAFYERRLKTDASVPTRLNRALDGFWPQGERWPMVFCDVVGKEEQVHTGMKGTTKVGMESKYNKEEAKKIVSIAKTLIQHYSVSRKQIAVLTPYSAQKDEIKKLMNKQELGDILVKTITESQGSEYGIVLLSTVRSKEVPADDMNADIGWIRTNLGFVADPHRICVGITRCQFGLVIVGDANLLKYYHIWRKLIEHYKSRGCFRSGKTFPKTKRK